MSHRHTVLRSMHDLSLASWFGGSLMGVVGLNGGASGAKEPSERLRLSSRGWARWAPVQTATLVAQAIGGVGLIVTNTSRLKHQGEARTNGVVKTAVTLAAAGTTLWSGILGTRIAKHASDGAEGVTEPGPDTSEELAKVQKQQRILQWVTPALTGVLIVLSAQQGEQQRPIAGLLHR